MNTIGVIVGSLRERSHNRRLAGEITDLLGELGPDVVEIRIGDVPAYNEDIAENEAVKEFRQQLAAVDGLVVVVPEYNGSVPGFLKNAIDWISVPLADSPLAKTPVAIFGSSTGLFGAVWSQADLRKILGLVKADVIGDGEIPIPLVHEKEIILEGDVKVAVEERLQLLLLTINNQLGSLTH